LKIYFGADHGGYQLKEILKEYARELGHETTDLGNSVFDIDDNYPDFIMPVAQAVNKDSEALGVVVGGSGQGEAIAANKLKYVRAFTFYGPALPIEAVDASGRKSDDRFENVRLSRLHNHSNIISFGGRFVAPEDAKTAFKIWLDTPYDTKDRYVRRIKQVEDIYG
jgi:ribose 5-phosphate isomerase B